MAVLDLYERKARLTPGLFMVSPVAFTIATLGLKKFPAISVAGGVLAAAGGSYLLAVLVASAGRRAQTHLYASWGGTPTTQLLRTRSAKVNATQRDIWRKAITEVT